jgi:transposase
LFRLQQQKQLDKDDETVAVPTARNFDTTIEQLDNLSKLRQVEVTVVGDLDAPTQHNVHKMNAERLLNFTRAKQNLSRLADMKKSNIDDVTPNFI